MGDAKSRTATPPLDRASLKVIGLFLTYEWCDVNSLGNDLNYDDLQQIDKVLFITLSNHNWQTEQFIFGISSLAFSVREVQSK